MFRRMRQSQMHSTRDQGFTLIELLVVIIIIGILAAIAIPIFLQQRQKAVDASLKSDLRNIATDMESYYTDYSAYPTSLGGTTFAGYMVLGNELLKVSTGNTIAVNFNAAADAYCLQGTNPKGAVVTGWFYVSNQGGLQPKGTSSCGSY